MLWFKPNPKRQIEKEAEKEAEEEYLKAYREHARKAAKRAARKRAKQHAEAKYLKKGGSHFNFDLSSNGFDLFSFYNAFTPRKRTRKRKSESMWDLW